MKVYKKTRACVYKYSILLTMNFIYSKLIIRQQITPTRLWFREYLQLPKKIINRKSPFLSRDNYLRSALNVGSLNMNEWIKHRKKILTGHRDINDKNVDSLILQTAVNMMNYNAAFSFITYLKDTGQDQSIGVINSLLHFYHTYANTQILSNEQRQAIISIHTKLYDQYKNLDPTTGENLLLALCSVDEWQKGIKVLDNILVHETPMGKVFNVLIATLFKNNEKVEALKFIGICLSNNRELSLGVYNEWINYIHRNYTDRKSQLNHLKEIVEFISSNCIVIDVETAKLFIKSYASLSWEAEFTSITKQSGQCATCKKKLNCKTLSQDEFNLLRNHVTENMIIGRDVFINTSPKELKLFSDFIKLNGPYDIVLDGLNIALGGKAQSREDKIFYVVDYFIRQRKNILIIGRKHMQRWLQNTFKNVHTKLNFFFVENMSQDDPFIITATMLSGPNTDFVTKDLLRNHLYLMKDKKLKFIFRRWQWQHQWMYIDSHIQKPLCFTPWPQNNGEGWHLPYKSKHLETDSNGNNIGVPDCSSWLCLKSG